jgi:hypothetical protein
MVQDFEYSGQNLERGFDDEIQKLGKKQGFTKESTVLAACSRRNVRLYIWGGRLGVWYD